MALLDSRKVGVPTTVFVEITLTAQADEILDAFEKAVSKIPDVLECHLMAGSAEPAIKWHSSTSGILDTAFSNASSISSA